MANQDPGRIIEHALVRLPGAIPDTVKLELATVLNEFCEATNIWNRGVSIKTAPGVDHYALVVNDAEINRLLNVVGADNHPVPSSFEMPNFVVLGHMPNNVVDLTANIALLPDVYAPFEVPDWIYSQYRAALLDGLLGRMMTQIAKPYSNEKAAVFHTKSFNRAVLRAKNEVMHRFMFRGQGWMFPQSVRTRNQRGWIW